MRWPPGWRSSAGRTAVLAAPRPRGAELGAGPGAAAATAAEASLGVALASGLLLVALGALLQITDVGAAGEFGVALAAIVLADALIGRLACAVLPAKGPFRGEPEAASAAARRQPKPSGPEPLARFPGVSTEMPEVGPDGISDAIGLVYDEAAPSSSAPT